MATEFPVVNQRRHFSFFYSWATIIGGRVKGEAIAVCRIPKNVVDTYI